MKIFEQREYQQTALDEIRFKWERGVKNLLLHLPTGSGKTHIFSTILINSPRKCAMFVRGRDLVENASARLRAEGVPHGVKMANHWNCRPSERIQICSIDTVSRRQDYPNAEIIVIDEAHFALSKSFKQMISFYKDKGAYILGCSATPYTTIGLGHLADSVVKPTNLLDLANEGYLVLPRYYSTFIPNLKGVKKVGDDYDQKLLETAVNKNEIVGDIPGHYKKFGENRPFLGFAVTVKHSLHCVEQFEKAGIPTRHLDAGSSDEERAQGLEDLRTGKIKGIWNVNIFSTGKDIPFLSCIISARPTKSLILHIQQLGRGTRTFDGDEFNPAKTDFIVLDHAGNVPRHGRITEDYEANIEKDTKKKKNYDRAISVKICRVCYFIYESGPICPACGSSSAPREYESKDGNLKEIPQEEPEIKALRELRLQARREKRNRAWVHHRMFEKFGPKVANELAPILTKFQERFVQNKRREDMVSSFNSMLARK